MHSQRVKFVGFILVIFFTLVGPLLCRPASSEEILKEQPPQSKNIGDILKEKGFELTGSVTLDYYSRYVWRGQYLDRDSVLQPGLNFEVKGFAFGYWANVDLENKDALTSDESDYYVSYSHTLGDFVLTGGHTWYSFPEFKTSSKEIYATVVWDTFLNPTLLFAHDYEDGSDLNVDGDGNYWSLALSHSVPVVESLGVSLDLGVTYGYVDGQWLAGEGSHVTPTVGIKIPLTDSLSMTPTIGYNLPLGDLENPDIGNQENKVFGGVKTIFVF